MRMQKNEWKLAWDLTNNSAVFTGWVLENIPVESNVTPL